MTIRELITILAEQPDLDVEVILASPSDPEQTYGPLDGLTEGSYRADNLCYGRFCAVEDDIYKDGAPAVCLWPIS